MGKINKKSKEDVYLNEIIIEEHLYKEDIGFIFKDIIYLKKIVFATLDDNGNPTLDFIKFQVDEREYMSFWSNRKMEEDKLFDKLMKMKKEDLASYLVGLLSELHEEDLKQILEGSKK